MFTDAPRMLKAGRLPAQSKMVAPCTPERVTVIGRVAPAGTEPKPACPRPISRTVAQLKQGPLSEQLAHS